MLRLYVAQVTVCFYFACRKCLQLCNFVSRIVEKRWATSTG